MKLRVARRWRWALFGVGLVLGGGGFAWHRQARENTNARWSLAVPPRPDLARWPDQFAARVDAAERAARGRDVTDSGLAGLARLYHANGFAREAMQVYAALEQLAPGEPRWAYLLAHLLAGEGRLEDAEPRLRRAMALAPDYLPARLRLGDALLKANNVAAARDVFREVLERDESAVFAWLGLARCATARDEWTEAREHLQRALALEPDFNGAVMLLVTVSEHLGDEATARRLRARGIQEFVDFRDPWIEELWADCYDPYRLSVAAASAGAAGDVAATERWLRRAIELAPEDAAYPRQLGRLYLQQKKYGLARELLERAVALNPHDTEAWIPLVELLGTIGDRAAMEAALAAGLARNPDSPSLHHASGVRLARAGQTDEAVAEIRRAQKLKPDEVRAYIDLAGIFFRLGRVDEGVAELRQALVAEPGHPLPMGMLARHEILSGNREEARRWIAQLETIGRASATDLETIKAEFSRQFGRVP